MLTAETKQTACRLLVIEDDPDDFFLFKRAAQHAQLSLNREIKCEYVSNGLDAVLLVSQKDIIDKLPDALVLDLNMPRLNGIKFLRSLRNSLALKALPVFVLTTSAEAAVHAEAIQAGANKVFVKPNNSESLVRIATEIVTAAE